MRCESKCRSAHRQCSEHAAILYNAKICRMTGGTGFDSPLVHGYCSTTVSFVVCVSVLGAFVLEGGEDGFRSVACQDLGCVFDSEVGRRVGFE
jgi:hypothetical protein